MSDKKEELHDSPVVTFLQHRRYVSMGRAQNKYECALNLSSSEKTVFVREQL